jgi:gluconokinase
VPPLVAAVDLGTSSARALLFDGLGRSVEGAASSVPYEMSTMPDGGVEIEASRLVAIVERAIDDLLARASTLAPASGAKIEAVAVCTFWHSLMGVDAEGRAATPVYSWNDTRASSAARELRDSVDERELHRRTGCVLHASYWPAKLAWLKRSRPEIYKRVAGWMSAGEFLYLRLFGEAVCSVSMASATGLFDQHKAEWDSPLMEVLEVVPERLSPLTDAEALSVRLRPEYARRWAALTDAVWLPALGDGACSNIGSGCVTRESAALMVGTSGALRVMWEAPRVDIPQGLWCYRADRRRYVLGGALSNGGDLFEWMRATLRLGEVEEVEALLSGMKADAHGLTILPFLSGERSTGWAGDARAAIMGMSLDTTPLEILRAGLESVAYRFAAVYDLLVKGIGEPASIIASGAAMLHSEAWAQIISDVIGKPITVSAESEPSSRGAALMALEAIGAIPALEQVGAAPGRTHLPDAERHRLYAAARLRQQRMYEALIP